MIATDRHHATVAQELSRQRFKQPPTVPIASKSIGIAIELGITIVPIQWTTQIGHHYRVFTELCEGIAVSIGPSAQSNSIRFNLHDDRFAHSRDSYIHAG
ncbi:MAG: hypothetical protein V4751_05955 [Pseudomonadota bacterium]